MQRIPRRSRIAGGLLAIGLLLGARTIAMAGTTSLKSVPCATVAASPKADYSNSRITGCNFTGMSFSGTSFAGSNLQTDNFSNTSLQNVSFAGATLNTNHFDHANLNGVDFTGAILNTDYFNYVTTGPGEEVRTNGHGTGDRKSVV